MRDRDALRKKDENDERMCVTEREPVVVLIIQGGHVKDLSDIRMNV